VGAKCVVCKDPRRANIDKALEDTRAVSKVSRDFKYSRATITRHRDHIVRKPVVEMPSDPSSSEVSKLKAIAQGIVDTAEDDKVRIAALRELRGYLELEIRVHQEEHGASSLVNDPAFQRLAGALATTLCADCRANIDVLTADAISVAHAQAAESAAVSVAPDVETPGEGGIPALE
jgi:hypothetical protein